MTKLLLTFLLSVFFFTDLYSAEVSVIPLATNNTYPDNVWDDFVSNLRNGDMKSAYDLLTPQSKSVLTYRNFCAKWHPFTNLYSSIVSPPGFSEFKVFGDIATLRIGHRKKINSKASFTTALLIREDDKWRVCTPEIAVNSMAEADARNFLRDLFRRSSLLKAAMENGKVINLSDIRTELPRLFEEEGTSRALEAYKIEIDVLRDGVVRARSNNKNLRSFELNAQGKMMARRSAPPQTLSTEELVLRRQKDIEEKIRLKEEAVAKEIAARKRSKEMAARKVDKTAGLKSVIKRNNEDVFLPIADLPEAPPELSDPDTPALPPETVTSRKAKKIIREDSLPEFDDEQFGDLGKKSFPEKSEMNSEVNPVPSVDDQKELGEKRIEADLEFDDDIVIPGISAMSAPAMDTTPGTDVKAGGDKLDELQRMLNKLDLDE